MECECCCRSLSSSDVNAVVGATKRNFFREKLIFVDDFVLIGSHIAFSNSCISDLLKDAISIGIYSVQFYLGGQQTYTRSKISEDDIKESNRILQEYPMHIFTHSPVIYNLAGSVTKNSLAWHGNTDVDKMMNGIIDSISYELSVISKIGAIGTVVHPGYRTKDTSDFQAIEAIAKTLSEVRFPDGSSSGVILEICAGEKNRIGKTLDQLIQIRDLVTPEKRERITFCIDTAHAFGSGLYELSKIEGVQKMFDEIDETHRKNKGKIVVIHLNDSLVPFGSNKDRHQLIGKGYIWGKDDTSLKYLLMMAGERRIPCVLETNPVDVFTIFKYI